MKKPALFPLCCGLVVISLPHVFHTGMDAGGIFETLAGALLVAVAFLGHSWAARIAQAVVGIAVAVVPFLVDAHAYLLYSGIIMGKVIALSALMPPGLFDSEEAKSG
jgi:hypothetical protein